MAITVVMGVLFLTALVLPSFVRVLFSRREDVAFRRAVGELVSAGDSKEVGAPAAARTAPSWVRPRRRS